MADNDNRQRGELPPHREDDRARQQEAQEEARPNPNTRDDRRGRDASRTGSDSDAE